MFFCGLSCIFNQLNSTLQITLNNPCSFIKAFCNACGFKCLSETSSCKLFLFYDKFSLEWHWWPFHVSKVKFVDQDFLGFVINYPSKPKYVLDRKALWVKFTRCRWRLHWAWMGGRPFLWNFISCFLFLWTKTKNIEQKEELATMLNCYLEHW